jgi:hypothetical protein
MFSRVKDLKGVAVLLPFGRQKIYQRLSQEIRDELALLQDISHETASEWFTSVTGNEMELNQGGLGKIIESGSCM